MEDSGLHDYPAQRAAEDSIIRVTEFVLLEIAGPALLEGPAWEQIVRKPVAGSLNTVRASARGRVKVERDDIQTVGRVIRGVVNALVVTGNSP